MSTDQFNSEIAPRDDSVIKLSSEKIPDDPKSAAWGWFVDFANNSSLHGVKYFGDRRRHWSEKMFWILSFFISVGGCSLMIHQNYQSWLNDLIIVGVDKDSAFVSSIPFPAVTICSETKVRVEQVNMTKALDSLRYFADAGNAYAPFTPEERNALAALAQICEPTLMIQFELKSKLKADEIFPLLKAIAPYKIFDVCDWKVENKVCEDHFYETFTDEGVCFTFNGLHSNEIFQKDILADDFRSMYSDGYEDWSRPWSKSGVPLFFIQYTNKTGGEKFLSDYDSNESTAEKENNSEEDNYVVDSFVFPDPPSNSYGNESTANKHENDSSTEFESNESTYHNFEKSNSTHNGSDSDFAWYYKRNENSDDDEYSLDMGNGRQDFGYLKKKLSSDSWSVDSGYKTSVLETYPRRVLGTGNKFGLDLILKTRKADLDGECRNQMQGFKVILHNPGEIPRLSQKFFRVPVGKQIDLKIKPIVVTTSEGLAAYSPERRQCYFSDEGNLKFFKIYTEYHCELECLAAYTLKKCKCVKFSMPRDNTTRICSRRHMNCYNSIEEEMLELQFNLKNSSGSTRKTLCGCLPSCTFTSYDAEVSEAVDYSREKDNSLKNAWIYSQLSDDLIIYSKLSISFKDLKFASLKRSELYGTTGFISNCGGLLGLFLGVSILTIVEILYYISLRIFCQSNVRKNYVESN